MKFQLIKALSQSELDQNTHPWLVISPRGQNKHFGRCDWKNHTSLPIRPKLMWYCTISILNVTLTLLVIKDVVSRSVISKCPIASEGTSRRIVAHPFSTRPSRASTRPSAVILSAFLHVGDRVSAFRRGTQRSSSVTQPSPLALLPPAASARVCCQSVRSGAVTLSHSRKSVVVIKAWCATAPPAISVQALAWSKNKKKNQNAAALSSS